ncbi:O-antigen ligase family protein [Agromyces binzhouensis]|uniref:O-antigen ligase domain-containing protein n=1 Tax=Agromyces binzhouensis TaxID=1817495 RepID=A0A4Q2JVE5_9MICO|nr:O-antigen ligase family protein [Agromyces binzhouensis]RXZ50148.1 O-antigen ligase domain-containing protein [Agromyces binzhouensis]
MSSTSERRAIRHLRVVEWWSGVWRWVLMAFGAVAVIYLLLDRGASGGAVMAVVLAAFIVAASLTGSKPLAIALFAVPGLLIPQRIGIGGGDLSVSDAALAAAFGTALLLGQRPYSTPLRRLLMLNLLYQFATLFTVLVNPYLANTFEWFHAWLLVSGALIVGWALGAAGYGRLALSMIVFTACVLAFITLVQAASQYTVGNFGPAAPSWPISMHKNFVGTVFAFAAVIAYLNPDWVGWTKGWSRLAFWMLVAGTVASQSRQALIGLMAAVMVAVIRRSTSRRSRILILLLLIPAAWLIVSMVVEQVQSQNQHNSVFQRLDWFREVYHFWRESPIFGHGLRYWYQPGNLPYQPPQGELEVLASAGLVGLAAFAVMWVGILLVLWHIDPRFGTLAVAVVFSRLVQAQFDLFWVAAQVSIPFVIAGVCLGAMAREERRADVEALAPPGRALAGPASRGVR